MTDLMNTPQQPELNKADKNWSIFIHLLPLIMTLLTWFFDSLDASETHLTMKQLMPYLTYSFIGFIPLFAIYLFKKDDSAYIAHHARECLNFYITGTIILMPLLFSVAALFSIEAIPFIIAGTLISLTLLPLGIFYGFWFLRGAFKASENNLYRYPYCIRFIKN